VWKPLASKTEASVSCPSSSEVAVVIAAVTWGDGESNSSTVISELLFKIDTEAEAEAEVEAAALLFLLTASGAEEQGGRPIRGEEEEEEVAEAAVGGT
jgi:hypothetical protein